MPSLRTGAWLVLIGSLGACERAQTAEAPPPAAAPAAVKPPTPVAPTPVAPTPLPAISVMPPPPSIETPPPPPRRVTPAMKWWAALTRAQRTDIHEVCKLKQADPCAGMLPVPRMPDGSERPDRYATIMRSFTAPEDREQISGFCLRNFPRGACNTPLVLAFDAQPIELQPATAERFSFRTGAAVASDWPTARTPWLALDRDGDGAIRSGAELFGDSTVLASGGTAPNGFAALAELDANGDGVIDRHDPAFAKLLLWTDRDGDHASSPGELRPLAETVIAIPVAHASEMRCDPRGNCEGERSAMVWRDASGTVRTGAVVDLYLVER